MSAGTSRLEGAIAGRDLRPGDTLVDLIDHYDARDELVRTGRRTRTVARLIPAGTRIALDRQGRAIPAEESSP